MRLSPRLFRLGAFMKMDTRKKNILTAVILIAVALTIYVLAVMKAISQ